MYYLAYKFEIYPNESQKQKIKYIMKQLLNFHNLLVYVFIDWGNESRQKYSDFDNISENIVTAIREDKKDMHFTNDDNVNKEITRRLSTINYNGIDIMCFTRKISDFKQAWMRCIKGETGKITYKKFITTTNSLFYDAKKVNINGNKVVFENLLGNDASLNTFKISESNYFPNYKLIYCPMIMFDGTRFWISLSARYQDRDCYWKENIIGIDLGIMNTTLSDGTTYKSINYDDKVVKLDKKINRLQRELKLKFLKNKYTFSKNYIKCKMELNKTYDKLSNIRKNAIYKMVNDIVKKKPTTIVVEHLKVQEMLNLKNISKKIIDSTFYETRMIIKTTAKKYGIKIIEADQYYPSSKMCSQCGAIAEKLSLSQRVYKCKICGLEIDRDLNAAINLKNYKNK